MSQGKPAKEMYVGRPRGDRNILHGNIVVTAVAGHYTIRRIAVDGKTQEFLGPPQNGAQALKQACALPGKVEEEGAAC